MKTKARVIAFYLPQFYPTPENDEWWEPGFTEWTNVARAKPLFKGHYQPRIPRDLGFYDLRVPETREKQAQLAREAGIEGFCYWHYWFGNGKRLLADVFNEVVETGKPDFPFCLCWANHSWYQKTWDPKKPNKLLMEQTYPGVEDYKNHFMAMLPAFKDKRYMKTKDGRLIFGIFEPIGFDDFITFKNVWNQLAKENGLNGFYFIGRACFHGIDEPIIEWGYDGKMYDSLFDVYYGQKPITLFRRIFNKLQRTIKVKYITYDKYVKESIELYKEHSSFIPCIEPDFDHSPRSNDRGIILHESTPRKWGDLLRNTIDLVNSSIDKENIIFIKAWNEWGEGNYLEPDRKWGREYLDETKNAILK